MSGSTSRRAGAGSFAWCAAALLLGAPAAAAEGPSQAEVTAAFLFNFSKFVEWPEGTFPEAADPIHICVLGENPFGASLADMVKGKQVGGRGISVRETGSVSRTAGCQIVFIASSEQGRLDEVIGRLADRPILTVSDVPSSADRGAVIGLVLEDRRVHFEVNMLAAARAGLKLSSQLLKVAVRLVGKDGPRP